MDQEAFKHCLKVIGGRGLAVVGDCRAEHEARLQEEQRSKAEKEQAYKQASADQAILSFDNWLDNVYYSGEFANSLYPTWRRIINEILERGVYEILFRGAIGTGKSTAARALQKYCLYYLTTFKVPHRAFTRHLVDTDPIVMVNMNVTAEKAKSAYFDSFRRSIYGTGYFQDKCVLKKGLINRLEIVDKSILCHFAGASKHAAESENLIFVALDEINLYENVEKSKRSDSGDKYDEAEVVDSAATHRQESRFINPDGTFPLPVKKVLLCKETYPDSYIARRARKIKEDGLDKVDGNGNQHSMIIHLAEWESKPKHYYIVKSVPENDQWFWIATGTRNLPARIITDKRRASDERKRIQRLKDEVVDEDLIPDLIRVPIMGGKYVDKAKINVEDFIRDICGRPTEAIDMYLKDRSLLTKAKELRVPGNPYPWFVGREQDAGQADKIQQVSTIHPFTAEATDLNDGVLLIRDRLVRRIREVGAAGEEYMREEPLVAPGAPRFVHLDMGLSSDAAGLAMVAIPGMKAVNRWDNEKDESAITLAPWLWPDFLMRFVPPESGQIRFSAIKSLVRELRRMGFRIVGVSADGFQSSDFLQWADEELGAETETISLDRTPEGYLELLRALTENRLVLYEHTWFESEVRALERKLTKRSVAGKTIRFEYIDHSPHNCFVGETRVSLLDGTFPMMSELDGKEVWVYSAKSDGTIVPGLARGRRTKLVDELVDVVLNSGAVARCTPEHLWMLQNGKYKAASELRPGVDRLMPINQLWPTAGGYEVVAEMKGNKYSKTTSHMVWEYFNGLLKKGMIVHHKNGVKTDNRPENLDGVMRSHHSREHTKKRHKEDDGSWRRKLSEGTVKFNRKPETRRKRSIAMKSRPSEAYVQSARKRLGFRSDITFDHLIALVKCDAAITNATIAASLLGCGHNVVVRILRDEGYDDWTKFMEDYGGENHKVRVVIPVKLDSPVPVYDLEVDEHHNFALAAGVFVHNSKDVCDGLAGAVLHATRKASKFTRRPSVPEPIGVEKFTPAQEIHERGRTIQEAMKEGNLDRVFDLTGGYNDGSF